MTATKTKTLPIRLTPEEHRTLSEAAKASGLGIGPWLRSLGLYHATLPRPMYVKPELTGISDVMRGARRTSTRRENR